MLYSAKGSVHLEAEGLQWLLPFQLPPAQTTELARAMEYTLAHLEKPNIDPAARAAGMSPRTLARRFADETQTTWQQWTHTARMLRAVQLLSIKGARVTEAGLEIGYTSPAAFSHVFAAFAGETPTKFRRQAQR